MKRQRRVLNPSAAEDSDVRNIVNRDLETVEEYSRTLNPANPQQAVIPKNRINAKKRKK